MSENPVIDAAAHFATWWASYGCKLQRVPLLKACEAETERLFESEYLAKIEDEKVREKMRAVALESNLAGLEEFGDLWYTCIKAKMVRMNLCADFVKSCMREPSCGFDDFEKALIEGAASVLPPYHDFYLAYLRLVQDPAIVSALEANPPPATDEAIHSHYTIISLDDTSPSGFKTTPFATAFKDALGPVLATFDHWISSCEAASAAIGGQSGVWDADARSTYVAFLRQYRLCLGMNASPSELEAAGNELDRKWMDTKMPIQLIHDIETGYGDPLCVKATPDISLRFLDETYAEQNATIADIQRRMMDFYKSRDTPLSKSGLTALGNTMAGIYFIPFKTGASLQFSFSGQSIPNRQDVAADKGIKIYFDAVETQNRVEINRKLVLMMFHEADSPDGVLTKFPPDAVDQLVWHVAAHEVGHAIYNLRNVISCFSSPSYETMLEEPRAELTAMFTMRLLHEQGVLDKAHTDMALAHFALDGLRYFDKYEHLGLRPYILFQVYAYKIYHRHGCLTFHPSSGKLVFDASKTLPVLDEFADCFTRILDCMDASDGKGLETILFDEIAPEDEFVNKVLDLLSTVKAESAGTAKPPPSQWNVRMCACHPAWKFEATCGTCET